MKIFLAFFVAMGSIVTLGDAACFTTFRDPQWPQKGCMMNGRLFHIGRTVTTEDCMKCDCRKDGLTCCSMMTHIPPYDVEKCDVIFNRERCDYVVVQKDDPSKECSLVVRVG